MYPIGYKEIEYHWNICKHICHRFADTAVYVDHGTKDDGNLLQPDVYSYEFRDILEIASEEFESVGKLLCVAIEGDEKKVKRYNICNISNTILTQFSSITDAHVVFNRYNMEPFRNWRVKRKVYGLDWWIAHNDSKHNGYNAFSQCNLINCVNAIASLIVLNLYLVKSQVGISGEITDIRTVCGTGDLGEFSVLHYCGEIFLTKGELELP